MPLSLSNPAQVQGDVDQIAHETGTIATGTNVAIQAAAVTIPAINSGDLLISVVRITRLTGADNINCGTHVTTATIQASRPHYLAATATAEFFSIAQMFISGSAGTNYDIIEIGAPSIFGTGTDLTYWGDLSTSKTVYLNVLRSTTSTFKYEWTIYRLGNNVK